MDRQALNVPIRSSTHGRITRRSLWSLTGIARWRSLLPAARRMLCSSNADAVASAQAKPGEVTQVDDFSTLGGYGLSNTRRHCEATPDEHSRTRYSHSIPSICIPQWEASGQSKQSSSLDHIAHMTTAEHGRATRGIANSQGLHRNPPSCRRLASRL